MEDDSYNDDDGIGININIEDILVDPSLEKEMKEIERREIVSPSQDPEDLKPIVIVRDPVKKPDPEDFTPSITLKDILNGPKIDVKQEMIKMVEVTAADLGAEENPIINDPSEILGGTINPAEIVQQLIADPLKNDALYAIIRKEDSTNNLLVQIMKEIAEELSYLKAYRKVHYLANEDVSEVSVKRVKSLKMLVETLLEKEKLQNASFDGKIDFSGEKFEKVMEFILTTVKETFEKVGIPEQFNDIFFIQLAQNLEGFEKKVEKIYYGTQKK
jgi:hypothetical protein